MVEAGKERVGVHGELLQAYVQVEQIAILAALQECAQLGSEEFFGSKRCDICLRLIPSVCDRKRILLDAEYAVVLTGVDFHLDFQGGIRLCLRRKPEDEVHGVARLLVLAVTEPGQRLTDGGGADLLGLCLYQVDIFGVAKWLLEEELVNGGAAVKCNLARQRRRIEKVTQSPADNQILLDLLRGRSGSICAPLLNVRCGSQKSASTGSLMTSFHLATRGASSASVAINGLTDGSRSSEVFAFLTKGSSALACGSYPA
jgi:hypothetical protein